MKTTLRVILIGSAFMLLGCNNASKQNPYGKVNKGLINQELVKSLFNMQVENALVTQHTLFPYHFVTNSAELNTLGERDFDVLAKHLAENPGTLNIRKGTTPDELYQSRVQNITAKLREKGLDTDKIAIVDNPAGGNGIASPRAIDIVQQDTSLSGGAGASTTSTSGGLK